MALVHQLDGKPMSKSCETTALEAAAGRGGGDDNDIGERKALL
jgi:hypothetical protein